MESFSVWFDRRIAELMPTLFDQFGPGLTPVYEQMRDDDGALAGEHRALLDAQWQAAEPFLDSNFHSVFARETAQRFWELRLVNAMLVMGFALEPAAGNRPDIATWLPDGRRLWIEATAPTLGAAGSPDRPRLHAGHRTLQAMPTEKVMLRLSQGVWDKTRRLRRYRHEGVIQDGDIAVIALSSGAHFPFIEPPDHPRILNVLFPLGDQRWIVDPTTDEVIRVEHAYRGEVIKGNGEPIAMTVFDGPNYADVSGLIYDFARPRGPGGQDFGRFCTIENPYADQPLPRGWLPLGDAWHVESHELICTSFQRPPKLLADALQPAAE